MATESKQRNEKFKYAALDIKDLTMTELIELKENLEKETLKKKMLLQVIYL